MQNETYLSAASTNTCLSCFFQNSSNKPVHTTLQTQMHCRRLHGEEPLLCFDHVLRICTTGMQEPSYTCNIHRMFTEDVTDRFLRNAFCSERTHRLHVGSLLKKKKLKKKKSENLEQNVGSNVFYKNNSLKYVRCKSPSQSSLTRYILFTRHKSQQPVEA